MPVPGCATAQPGWTDAMMTKVPEQSRPGTTRKVLVVIALFAIAIAFFVASFLVHH
jgi:hypothetical protein